MITEPVLIIVGDKDRIAPMETNAKLYADGIKGAKMIIMPGEVGHFTSPIDGRTKKERLEIVSSYSWGFFEGLWKKTTNRPD